MITRMRLPARSILSRFTFCSIALAAALHTGSARAVDKRPPTLTTRRAIAFQPARLLLVIVP